MTRLAAGLAAAAILAACADAPAPLAPADGQAAARAITSTTKFEINETVVQFEPCANEVLEYRVRQQVVEHTTINGNGTEHFHFVVNDRGTRAVGTVTGRVWNQTGATQGHFNVDPALTGNETFTEALNLVGRGSAPNLRLKEIFHITVNPQGVVTVEFGRITSVCR